MTTPTAPSDQQAPKTAPPPPLWGLVVLATLVIAGIGLQAVSQIVGPVFLVLTLVITVQPLRTLLTRRKVPPALASVIAMLVIYLVLIGILGAVVLSLAQLVEVLPTYSAAFTNLTSQATGALSQFGINATVIQGFVSQLSPSSFSGVASSLLSGITSGLSLLALIVAMVIFLAFDAGGIGERVALIRRQRPHVADAFTDFATSVRQYWIVTTIFGLIVAAIDVVALFIIGVPLAVTWGVLAFVTNYIPNVGFLIGIVPPALIALLDGGIGPAIAVVITYCVINFVVQTIIQPRFTGDAVGITATVAFLSLIVWAYLLGALGALLAVPATLFVKALLVDHSPTASWFGALINSSPGGKKRDKGKRNQKDKNAPTPNPSKRGLAAKRS